MNIYEYYILYYTVYEYYINDPYESTFLQK